MSEAHTPGKWVVASRGFEGKPTVVARRAGRPVTVALLDSGNREEDAANARIIADAPNLKAENAELLTALKGLEAALRTDAREKTISRDTMEYHLDGQAMYHAINAARAAIAKAEGRT